MRFIHRGLLGAALLSVLAVSFAPDVGADDRGRERRDARRYRELQTELRDASQREEQLLERAVEQARDNEGRSEPSTLAQLTNVMEEKDRLHHHLRELALRNGWDLPDADDSDDTAPAGALGRMVGRASAAVQAELAEEAREIASRLALPLLPLPAPPVTAESDDTADAAENTDRADAEEESDGDEDDER